MLIPSAFLESHCNFRFLVIGRNVSFSESVVLAFRVTVYCSDGAYSLDISFLFNLDGNTFKIDDLSRGVIHRLQHPSFFKGCNLKRFRTESRGFLHSGDVAVLIVSALIERQDSRAML